VRAINVEILKHPVNWAIILLMVLIAGFAGSMLLTWIGVSVEPKNARVNERSGGGFAVGLPQAASLPAS
jgi:hypothetical protein